MSRRIASLLIAVSLVGWILPVFGTTSQAQATGGAGMRGFSVAIGASGEPWAVWSVDTGQSSDLYYSRWIGDQWLPARSLHVDAVTWDSFPSLAVAADGTPWVAWTSADETQGRLYISRWVGSRWSTPVEVPTGASSRPRQAVLAAAPDGGFWLAWVGFDGNDDEIYASRWDGLTWSTPERVGDDDADPLAYDTHPRLAVSEDGVAWLVWVSSEGLYDDVVMASRWDGRGWSPEVAVSAPDGTPDVWPSLALDAQGQPWVAWQDLLDLSAEGRWRIFVSRWQPESRAWTPEEMVSSPATLAIHEERTSLSFDAAGVPHLAWKVSGAATGIAYASWQNGAWTQAAWAAEKVNAEALVLLATESPWLVWPDLDSLQAVPMAERRLNKGLSPLPDVLPMAEMTPASAVVVNRFGAWGDSITLGSYDDPVGSGNPVGPYPGRLEEKLDTRYAPSEMFNKGVNSETTGMLLHRIVNEVSALAPNFVLIMSGTNDVTRAIPPSKVASNLAIIIDGLKRLNREQGWSSYIWLATLIPRMDSLNKDTEVQNEYIRSVAITKRVLLADQWAAFNAHPDWPSLMWDRVHPNGEGMQLLADTFYRRLLEQHSWVNEETVPPVTWVEPLPAQSLCGDVEVHWDGTDNLSYVTSYDVQWQLDDGLWTDWFVATQSQSGIYESDDFGSTVAFRVRGRDVVGNQSNWSAAVSTKIWDDGPPQDVQVVGLPAAQKAPFDVRWSAVDLCSSVTAYDVQWRVGLDGVWQSWLTSTANTSATFDPPSDPPSPEYGKAYYFRVRARDEAGNWSEWSPEAYTYLARYVVEGGVFNVRHQPVLKSTVQMPGSLAVIYQSNRYAAYVAEDGPYDLSVSRADYGAWPAMRGITVTADLDGLDLILPSLDNVVEDGGFETGSWGQWQVTGTATPTFSADARSGNWAALLGGGAGTESKLSQTLAIPTGLTDPTLSFMVRLDDDAAGSGTLRAELEGTIAVVTSTVPAGGWAHVWLPIEEDLGGQSVTLTFSALNMPPLRLDEVSVGSALKGGSWVYLPAVMRMVVP